MNINKKQGTVILLIIILITSIIICIVTKNESHSLETNSVTNNLVVIPNHKKLGHILGNDKKHIEM